MRERRAKDIDQGLRNHLDTGGGAVFLTLTLRHHKADPLAIRLAVIAQALHLVLQGSPWNRRRLRLGYIGAIRAVEITYGRNGWHPHMHAVLLFDRPLTAGELADLDDWIFGRWAAVAERRNLGTVTRANGIDLRPITTADDLGGYLTKIEGGWGAGLELARADLKRGRHESFTPMQLLEQFVATGDARLLALWQEYEEATFGKRAIVWSPGLRDRLLPNVEELTDEQAAAAEGESETVLRVLVEARLWLKALRAGVVGQVLTEIEQGAAVVLWLCDLWGVPVRPLDGLEARYEDEHGAA